MDGLPGMYPPTSGEITSLLVGQCWILDFYGVLPSVTYQCQITTGTSWKSSEKMMSRLDAGSVDGSYECFNGTL